jgi:hypothetical protein
MARLKMIKKHEKKFSEVFINVVGSDDSRKAGFAFFNREVNLGHVESIQEKMRTKGYRASETIYVIKAESAPKSGITKLCGMNGETVTEEEFHNYYLVIEGQHRTYAASMYNDWLVAQSLEPIKIPAIEVDFQKDETLIEYLNEINVTKREWSKEDYLRGSANICQDVKLLQRYNELIKTESNPRGFSLSTLNLIFCNGSGGLSKNDLVLLCSGAKKKGIKVKLDIIPSYDLETGEEFIKICKTVGFRDSEITKRYLIKEFNKIRNSGEGGLEIALNVFKTIKDVDIKMMTNKNENLIEQEVINYFDEVKRRRSETSPSQAEGSNSNL